MNALSGFAPRQITVMHPGGLGDMVLVSALLAGLRAAWPEASLTLMCRPEVASVTRLFPFELSRIIALTVNPYRWSTPSFGLFEETGRLLEVLPGDRCDLFIAADEPPTWLTPVVCASLAARRTIAPPTRTADIALADAVLARLQLKPFNSEPLSPHVPDRSEIERYGDILAWLGAPAPDLPTLLVPEDAQRDADDVLASLGASADPPVACFYRGDHAAVLKRWPPERYVDALDATIGHANACALFIGDAGDASALEDLAVAARSRGMRTASFINRSASIVPVAAVVRRCRGFFGLDSGLQHLAAALGLPGVTVYGGGTWSRYRPWASGTIGVVHPLPCFGCGWDCAFGRGICVDSIDTATVVAALAQVLADPPQEPAIVECANRPTTELELIGSAAACYREAAEDRALRLDAIVELQTSREVAAEHRWKTTAELHAARELVRRSEEELRSLGDLLLRKETELQRQVTAAAERAIVIKKLMEQKSDPVVQEKLELKEAELQRIAAAALERQAIIERQSADIEVLKAEKQLLAEAAAERLRALEEAHAALGSVKAEGELRSALLSDLTAIVEEREAEIASLRGAKP